MEIVRFQQVGRPEPRVGRLENGRLFELPVGRVGELLGLRAAAFRSLLSSTDPSVEVDRTGIELLAPVDGKVEVWASGVTYESSRQARMEESQRDADIYRRVYDAARPELFFKAVSWKVVGDGQPVAIRADSTVNVPEPELAVVCNCFGEIVAYSVCDDVSSRSIEGENPLYLPQAKVYRNSCAVGPGLRPAWEVEDPYELRIELSIERAGEVIWQGATSTARLRRRFDELVGYLYRADHFPEGVVLSTGTGLVPELPFSLEGGDRVVIGIESVGTLCNPVVQERSDLRGRLSGS